MSPLAHNPWTASAAFIIQIISLLLAAGKLMSFSTGYPVPYSNHLSMYLTALSLLIWRLPILSRHIAAFGDCALGRPAQPSASAEDLARLEILVNRYVDRALGTSAETWRQSSLDQRLDQLEVRLKDLVERKMRERRAGTAAACAVAGGNEAGAKLEGGWR